ncbi:IS701 family transposase [Crossiella sp. SN42]|nr:IS701 family transposase [Crossiella sp. SN42]MCO1580299.1 IS701 family transposase [Crossiella sp. SN42]
MAEVRPVIEGFAAEMFGGFDRRDQRGKGELYLRGLLLDGKRKSMQPMAGRLGVDHQQLQQFLTTSTWSPIEVRRRLAVWAAGFVDPDALVIDDTGFPKDGTSSPGVARMYCGALGKRGNCQIGVSVHAVTDWASTAVDWRLFLPVSWDETQAEDEYAAAEISRKRARCAIPDEARHREKWRLALDMIDETIDWGMPPRPVAADAAYGDATAFRHGLTDRGLTYVLAVSASTSVHPGESAPVPPTWSGTGRPPVKTTYPDKPVTVKTLVTRAGRSAGRFVLWRHGSRKTSGNPTAGMRSRFLALRVRPANRNIPRGPDGSLPECWLLAEWPTGAAEPTDYWLSTLPADIHLRDMVKLAKIRWRVEHDYRELKDGLGLDHFEGRSWLGWHRHATLASVAQAICTQLRHNPKAPARA